MEYNLVEMWLRKDPIRWISGVFAGLLAGIVAMGIAMLISKGAGMDLWFPVKLMGTIVLGPSATDMYSSFGIFPGVLLFETLCAFFGFVYAHFTGTNCLGALVPMGLVWGTFSWIFIWNLFMQSFQPIFAAQIPSGPVLFICWAYGLTLASVAFFDPILRRTR